MRSTKDLVDIVTEVRGLSRSKQASAQRRMRMLSTPKKATALIIREDFERQMETHQRQPSRLSQKVRESTKSQKPTMMTTQQAYETAPMTRQPTSEELFSAAVLKKQIQKNSSQKSLNASVNHQEDLQKKLRKLEVLAQADKDTIEVQQRKMHAFRAEIDSLKEKYSALKIDYEKASNHLKTNATDIQQVVEMRKDFEKQIAELSAEIKSQEVTIQNQKTSLEKASDSSKEQQTQIENQSAEILLLRKKIDDAKEDFAKTISEDQQEANVLKDKIGSLEVDLKQVRDDLASSNTSCVVLQSKLDLSSKAAHKMVDLVEQLAAKDLKVDQMGNEIGKLKSELYSTSLSLKSVEQDLSNRIEQLEDTKQQVNELTDDKKALVSANKKLEKKLDKTTQELYNVKEALNSHGSNLEQVTVKLALAQENLAKSQNEKADLNRRLDSKTKTWLEDKQDLQNKLEEALQELQDFDNKANGIREKNKQLTAANLSLEEKLSDSIEELSLCKEQIFEKIETAVKYQKAKDAAEDQISQLQSSVTKAEEEREEIRDQLRASQAREQEVNLKNDSLTKATQGLTSLQKQLAVALQPIEQTLSCLSCLEYLSEPTSCTLVCGHSICQQCFNQHSDPTSEESIVFCEECKLETKNSQLKESKVIQVLSSKINQQRSAIASMHSILTSL